MKKWEQTSNRLDWTEFFSKVLKAMIQCDWCLTAFWVVSSSFFTRCTPTRFPPLQLSHCVWVGLLLQSNRDRICRVSWEENVNRPGSTSCFHTLHFTREEDIELKTSSRLLPVKKNWTARNSNFLASEWWLCYFSADIIQLRRWFIWSHGNLGCEERLTITTFSRGFLDLESLDFCGVEILLGLLFNHKETSEEWG